MAQPVRKVTDYRNRAEARLAMNRDYPDAAVSLEPGAFKRIEAIKTGAILVDLATMVGGFPRGRLSEIYGAPSSGKTSLTIAACAECQRAGGFVVYLDYEHAFDRDYAVQLGLDLSPEKFQLYQPDNLETGFELWKRWLENGLADMIVFDSLAAMVTAEELATNFGDKKIALTARGMAEGLKKMVGTVHKSNAACVFINHVGDVIGGAPSFGPPKKITPGGRALKFYASLRMEVVTIAAAKGKARNLVTGDMEDVNVAVKVQAQMVKNKCGAPFKRGTFFMRHGRGISRNMTAIEIGLARGMIAKHGARIVLPAFAGFESQNLPSFETAVQWLEKNDPEEVFVGLVNKNFLAILRAEMTAAPVATPVDTELDDDEDEEAMLSKAARDAEATEASKIEAAAVAEPEPPLESDIQTREEAVASVFGGGSSPT